MNAKSAVLPILERIYGKITRGLPVVPDYRGNTYHIDIHFKSIQRIVVGSNAENTIGVGLCYADTVTQAKPFYKSNINIKMLESLSDWKIKNSFHVTRTQGGTLFEFDSDMKHEDYIRYWIDNKDTFGQKKREHVSEFIHSLAEKNVIKYDNAAQEKMNKYFFNTNRTQLNMCPGFVLHFKITAHEAYELEKTGELQKIIYEKIKEGLSFANLNWREVLVDGII